LLVVYDWIHRLLPILKEALGDLGVLPERDPQQFARHEKQQGGSRNYIIDGTERRRQRPKNPETQAMCTTAVKRKPTVTRMWSLPTAGRNASAI
jgi:hypothetical protein